MKRKLLYGAMLVCAVLLGSVGCSSKSVESGDEKVNDAAVENDVQARGQEEVIKLGEGQTLPAVADKLMVVDFNATWCGPCRRFAPIFDQVAKEYAGQAYFYSVDVDEHPELAQRFRVQGIPMVAYIKPNGEVKTTVGLLPYDSFKDNVSEALR